MEWKITKHDQMKNERKIGKSISLIELIFSSTRLCIDNMWARTQYTESILNTSQNVFHMAGKTDRYRFDLMQILAP